jgi:hypothetical protein
MLSSFEIGFASINLHPLFPLSYFGKYGDDFMHYINKKSGKSAASVL